MVTYTDTTLQDVDTDSNKVNSGTAIEMNCNNIKYAVGVFTQADPQPGKSIYQDSDGLISYGDSIGFENPLITLNGTINLGDYSETDGSAPTNIISVKLLQQMYKSGHVFKLTDVYNSDPSTSIHRCHSLTGTFPNETITTINVKVKGMDFESTTQSNEGVRINYSLKLIEVRV